jgi:hypothetical protein
VIFIILLLSFVLFTFLLTFQDEQDLDTSIKKELEEHDISNIINNEEDKLLPNEVKNDEDSYFVYSLKTFFTTPLIWYEIRK